jgi:hypothetical protein
MNPTSPKPRNRVELHQTKRLRFTHAASDALQSMLGIPDDLEVAPFAPPPPPVDIAHILASTKAASIPPHNHSQRIGQHKQVQRTRELLHWSREFQPALVPNHTGTTLGNGGTVKRAAEMGASQYSHSLLHSYPKKKVLRENMLGSIIERASLAKVFPTREMHHGLPIHLSASSNISQSASASFLDTLDENQVVGFSSRDNFLSSSVDLIQEAQLLDNLCRAKEDLQSNQGRVSAPVNRQLMENSTSLSMPAMQALIPRVSRAPLGENAFSPIAFDWWKPGLREVIFRWRDALRSVPTIEKFFPYLTLPRRVPIRKIAFSCVEGRISGDTTVEPSCGETKELLRLDGLDQHDISLLEIDTRIHLRDSGSLGAFPGGFSAVLIPVPRLI